MKTMKMGACKYCGKKGVHRPALAIRLVSGRGLEYQCRYCNRWQRKSGK